MSDESSDWPQYVATGWLRYMMAARTIDDGVRRRMSHDGAPDDSEFWPGDTSPRALRTGINMAVSDHAALVDLLCRKGIITREEYWSAFLDGMERMARMYEQPENNEEGKT